MKSILLSAFILCSSWLAAQSNVTIKGDISNLDGHQIIIYYNNGETKANEKVETIDGKFEANLKISSWQEIILLPYKYDKTNIIDNDYKFKYIMPYLTLLVMPDDIITIKGDALSIWESEVSGGVFSRDQNEFRQMMDPFNAKEKEIKLAEYEMLKKGDSEGVAKKKEEIKMLTSDYNTAVKKFYTEKTENIYALYKFYQLIKKIPVQEAENQFNLYSESLQKSVIGQNVAAYLERSKNVEVGADMIDFKGPTLDGKTFDSKSQRGNYLLLDFWGSWCNPCRKSHPHLVELYDKYKDRGFRIVGIAHEMATNLEAKKKSALRAIETDKLTWPQLLNDNIDGFNATKAYNVSSFPTKILIDKNGKILWRGTGMNADGLDELLSNIFKDEK
jgi:thiol-disulfide isomerase/thioredoxin